MKLLVIDNLTLEMHSLSRALNHYPHEIISYKDVNIKLLNKYDKIILTGGHAFNLLHKSNKYKNEIKLITHSKKPILGICLGFQLICRAYGAKMGDLKKFHKGLLRINKLKSDPILNGLSDTFMVFENHKHIVKKVTNKLIPLAISEDGIEIVKHSNKPIWGTQFHPEKFVKKNEGRKLLKNFLNY